MFGEASNEKIMWGILTLPSLIFREETGEHCHLLRKLSETLFCETYHVILKRKK